MEALRRGSSITFEQSLAEHCRRFFPRISSALGDNLPSSILEAIGRGRAHGFDTQRDLCKYINLVFTFGRDFDRSSLFPWASRICRSALPGPAKMEELYAAGLQHQQEARGYFAPREEPH